MSARRCARSTPARRRRTVVPLLACALAVGLAACGGSGSSAKPKPGTPVPLPHAVPTSMFTVGAELYANPTAGIYGLHTLGVQAVRLDVNWSAVAPRPKSPTKPDFDATDPSAYPAMARYDALVKDLQAQHIDVDLALIGPPPRWAEGPGAPTPAKQTEWEPSAADYTDWVRAVGARYDGHFIPHGSSHPLPRVNFWSIWNEPNIGVNLAPETTHSGSAVEVAPKIYREMLDGAWTSLGATGHGQDRILIGELAPQGAGKQPAGLFNAMAPLRFLRALYCVDANYQPLTGTEATERGCPATSASGQFAAQNPALFKAPGFAIHPYSFTSLPPNVRIPDEPDYAELAALPTFESSLDHLQHVYGSSKKFPIWSTEFGYITNPPNPGYTITPAKAAYYLNWAEYISFQDPRVKSFDQFLLSDPPGTTVFATGLETNAGVAKPTLAAYRLPLYMPVTTGKANRPLLVWGGVRPGPTYARGGHKVQSAQLQFAPSGGTFSTIDTVSATRQNGYFELRQSFPESGTLRLRWVYPTGQIEFSRSVDVTVH